MYTPGQKYETMVGIGCGKEDIHAIEFPIDTVRFLKAVDRKRRNRTGALVLADLNANKERTHYRRRLIEVIIGITAVEQSQLEIVQQSEMKRDEVKDVIRISDKVPEVDRKYVGEEAKDCRSLLERNHGIKFGWVLDLFKQPNGDIDTLKSKGGELLFDQEIERNFPRQYIFDYTDVVGIPITAIEGKNKCPYVVKQAEIKKRLCIVNQEQLDEELEKLKRTIKMETRQSKKAIEAAIEFSQIIIGRETRDTRGIKEEDLISMFRDAQTRLFTE